MAKSLRDKLEAAFDRSGLTYAQVGSSAGLSESSTWKKINGEQKISSDEAERLAKALGLKIVLEPRR